MGDHEKLGHARRRMIRYRILKILDVGRPYPVGEGLLLEVLQDADLQATHGDVRKGLQYLCDKGYLKIDTNDNGVWEARLLPKGVDFIEMPNAQDPGIARPSY